MGLNMSLQNRRAVASYSAAVRGLPARTSAALTPQRRTAIAVVSGVILVVWGLALWSLTVALVAAGISLIVYGAVIVDLDASPVRRRRKKKVIE